MRRPIVVEFEPEETPASYSWTWNGRDEAERPLFGTHSVKVEVSYSYRCIYTDPFLFGLRSGVELRQPGGAGPAIGDLVDPRVPCRMEIMNSRTYAIRYRDDAFEGLGGWSVDVHHRLASDSGLMRRGDGGVVRAGTGFPQAEPVVSNIDSAERPFSFAHAPDGNVYFVGRNGPSGNHGIWRRSPAGVLTQLTQTSNCQPWEHETSRMCEPIMLAVLPMDASLSRTQTPTATAPLRR